MNESIATQAINEAANAFESFVKQGGGVAVKDKKSRKEKKRKDNNGQVTGEAIVEGDQEEPSRKKHKKSKKSANEANEQQVSWKSSHKQSFAYSSLTVSSLTD